MAIVPQNNKTIVYKKMEIWLARDESGSLFLFKSKPIKYKNIWTNLSSKSLIPLNDRELPEVKWSDEEPTKVKLVIKK